MVYVLLVLPEIIRDQSRVLERAQYRTRIKLGIANQVQMKMAVLVK